MEEAANGVGSENRDLPIDDITESDEGLLDSDREEVKCQGKREEFPELGELDYDELMENEGQDEVKVHISEDIEEGEVTSDEEGEIKESDDDGGGGSGGVEAPPTATPTVPHRHSETESGQVTDTTTDKGPSKDSTDTKRQRRREPDSSSDADSLHSKDKERGVGISGHGHPRERQRNSVDGMDKVPTICRHFLGGKCSWGNNCRFLHEDPAVLKDRQKHPDRLLGEFHGPPDAPWGPRGFPPPFLHGPMGHPRDLPPHIDLRGPFPHPPHGRGYGMHPLSPYGPIHSRDILPERPFDPMSRMEGRRQPYPRYNSRESRKGGITAEVTEETDGWTRLRTVTRDWSSEEEESGKMEEDLREKIKKRRGQEADSGSERQRAEDWSDPWARDIKKSKKKQKKASSSEDSSDSEEGSGSRGRGKARKSKRSESSESSESEGKIKKKKKKTKRTRTKNSSDSNSDSDDDDRKKKEVTRKRKKKRESTSSEEEIKKKRKKPKRTRHLGSPSPPPDPRHYRRREDFYPPPMFPPHIPLDDHPRWHPHPHHPHHYDFPPGPRPPHDHAPHSSPNKDQFGRDISKRLEYEDSRKHRHERPPPYHEDFPHRVGHREHPPWDPRRKPHPFDEPRRRHSSEDVSGSPTPPANLESGSSEEEREKRHKGKRSKSSDSDKSLTRKEKLLQELEAINKVIEKKKSRKHSS